MVKWVIILESFLVRHYILSRNIVIENHIVIQIVTYSSKVGWGITFPLYLVEPNFLLRKRMSGNTSVDSTLRAESIRTSLLRLEISILSLSAHESCVAGYPPLTPALHTSPVVVCHLQFFLALNFVQISRQSLHFPLWHLNPKSLPPTDYYQNSRHAY